MTYTELLTKLRAYTEVDDTVLTDTILNGFIQDTEFKIFREVDADYSRKYQTSTTSAGKRFVALPTDLYYIRSVQVTSGTDRVFLEKRDNSFIAEFYPSTTATATVPKYYANWDKENILLAPTPTGAITIQIAYVFTPEQLSSSNATTTISTEAPSLLLYGCLTECYGYLKGPMDMYKLYQEKYNEAIQAYALEQMGKRLRDNYDFGVPRIKVPSPSP
jgi:hypothetical protein